MAKFELSDEIKGKFDALTKDELIAKANSFNSELKQEKISFKEDEGIKAQNERLKALKEPYKLRIKELEAYLSYIIDILPNK